VLKVVGLRRIGRVGLQSCLGAVLALVVVGRASANPIVVPPGAFATSVADGVYILFLANLPIDILLFSALFLLVFWRLESPLRAVPKGANALVASAILAGIVIAVAGALIDFYGFYTKDAATAPFYVPVMTWESIALAGVGVFISVYAVSNTIGMLRLIPSLIPAGVITALNLVIWTVMDYPLPVGRNEFGDWLVLLVGTTFLFVPIVMFGIVHLHDKKGGKP
jgi:hypothetical protein